MLPPISGDHYTPRKKKEIEIDRLIGKCNSAQEFIGKSSELLKMKPRLNGLDDNLVQENVFSKSIKFKLDKEKVKNNIKNYVENQYSEKLKKIKSVVSFEEPRSNELLSPEDVQNKDAARFFSLNKRDFGNVSGVSQIKYEKPFKPKRTFQRVNPVETVLTSIKSIMQPQEKKEHDLPQGSLYTKDDLMKLIKQKSPKNRIIENELVKLWPGLDEKRSKEQKALQLKVQKLVRYKNEVSSLPILSPSSKSTRRNDAKEEPLS
jgi:hypothetical protein